MYSHMPEEPQSFFKRWRAGILFGVVAVVTWVAMRSFFDYRANAPLVDPYLGVINEISSQSPGARQRLEQYYAKHQRQTVASKHFWRLCNEMEKLALQDEVTRRWLDEKGLGCPMVYDIDEKPS